jgi:hypothetical protein
MEGGLLKYFKKWIQWMIDSNESSSIMHNAIQCVMQCNRIEAIGGMGEGFLKLLELS